MKPLPRPVQPLDARLAALAGGTDAPMRLSELDGFVAGILVCPDMIMPGEWLPVVLGDAAGGGGIFPSEADLQDCIQLVFGHYNAVSQDLQHLTGVYRPVFDVDAHHETLWKPWMRGFDRAMALRPQSWRKVVQYGDDDAAAVAMAGLVALVAITENAADMDPERIAALSEAAPALIPLWIETLNRWRLRTVTGQPIPARSTKVGRNQPCPCGSGQKHKKCCGSN